MHTNHAAHRYAFSAVKENDTGLLRDPLRGAPTCIPTMLRMDFSFSSIRKKTSFLSDLLKIKHPPAEGGYACGLYRIRTGDFYPVKVAL